MIATLTGSTIKVNGASRGPQVSLTESMAGGAGLSVEKRKKKGRTPGRSWAESSGLGPARAGNDPRGPGVGEPASGDAVDRVHHGP
jgi:hypothetical protein